MGALNLLGWALGRACKGVQARRARDKRVKEGPHVSKVGYGLARRRLAHILRLTGPTQWMPWAYGLNLLRPYFESPQCSDSGPDSAANLIRRYGRVLLPSRYAESVDLRWRSS